MNWVRTTILYCLVAFFLCHCASRSFVVSDSDLYADGIAVDSKHLQLVESQATTKYLQPAAETFQQNCQGAETKALERFRILHPLAKDTGVRAGERFDKNGGCTVRMIFAHN